ncbi:MAG TPA: 50S ribosomal protein L18Ae [archaeon]|nr:50S ribosomal protein L18Ae [archaeon]
MEQKTFTIKGAYSFRGKPQKFSKEITAHNQTYAKEKTLSAIGSKHKIKRNAIQIQTIEEKK